MLSFLGDLWKDSPVEKLANKSKKIKQWLQDHPEEIDEAIDNDLWLDHDAGKLANLLLFLLGNVDEDLEGRKGKEEDGIEGWVCRVGLSPIFLFLSSSLPSPRLHYLTKIVINFLYNIIHIT